MQSLSDQVKAPYLVLHDAYGNLIATTIKGSGTVVTRFSYSFNDDEDDKCIIKIQTNNPRAFDMLGIGRGSLIQFSYGYMNGPMSPAGFVVIRDSTTHYGDSEIVVDLNCADLLTYLKVARANDTESLPLIDYLKNQCYKRYNIEIRDGNKTIFRQVKAEENVNETVEYTVKLDDWESPNFDPTDDSPEGFKKVKRPASISDLTNGKWFDEGPIKDFLTKPQSIISSSRSQFVVIQDILKACPKGPWYVTGRGDTLLIHNRNLGAGPVRVYSYMNDNKKVDIVAKTNYESFETETLSYSGMDPSERKNYYINDYRKQLWKTRTFKEIITDRSLSEEEFKKEMSDYLEMRYSLYNRWMVSRVDGDLVEVGTIRQALTKYGMPQIAPYPTPIKDFSNTPRPDPMNRSALDTLKPGDIKPDRILRFKWLTVPMEMLDDIRNCTDNNQREMEMNKEEARITVEGDPFLQSQMVVRLTNISRVHEGNYYIKKCEHSLDSGMGYETTMDCIKVLPEAINTKTIEEEKVRWDETGSEDVPIKKQYKTEQKLFKDVIRIGYNATVSYGYGAPGAGGLGQHSDYIEYEDLDELWASGYSQEQLLDKATYARDNVNKVVIKEPNAQDS